MPCYNPMFGWRGKYTNPKTGKRPLVFRKSDALQYEDRNTRIYINCGKCDGCMIDKAREWALRCVNEASMWERNCFVTLTYSDINLPDDGSLSKNELQLFIKRLRQHNAREALRMSEELGHEVLPDEIRYFGCGEYGKKMDRPHYHLCLFNYDFLDKEVWSVRDKVTLYRSPTLERLWDKGFSTIGEVTAASAGYIARYTSKKLNARNDPTKYEWATDSETGEVFEREPEFGLMSKRPGIGKYWIERYLNDVRKDFMSVDGNIYPIPRYYREFLEEYDKRTAQKLKRERKRKRKEAEEKGEYTSQRLEQKEAVKKAQLKMLVRRGENA